MEAENTALYTTLPKENAFVTKELRYTRADAVSKNQKSNGGAAGLKRFSYADSCCSYGGKTVAIAILQLEDRGWQDLRSFDRRSQTLFELPSDVYYENSTQV